MIYENYTIFTPGPVKMSDDILEIGSKQTPYFRNQAFSEVLLKSEKLLLEFLNAPTGSRVIFLTASGTAGMEASVMNLLTPSDKTLVVNGGGFGQRFVDICNSYEIPIDEIDPKGSNLSDIEQLVTCRHDTLIINAHETSVGVLYDLNTIGQFVKKHKLFNIVDAISMFTTDEIDMQKHHIDVAIVSSQKGLALPPGLTMVALSPKAIDRLEDVKSHYFNFKNYLTDGERGQTPYTPAVSIILQLLARLEQIKADGGITETQKKAKEIAEYFRDGIRDLPLGYYTKHMPNAMTTLVSTDGKDARKIVKDLEEKYRVILTPNGGELGETIFRIGHMGDMNKKYVDILLNSFSDYYLNN